ncbi:MAG: nuclear transport factor 2 family protein, partial [Bacteroidetes bacterium]
MKMIRLLTTFKFLVFLLACNPAEGPNVQNITSQYFQTYAERADFDKFLDFYADTLILEDMMMGERIEGKESLARFFDWENQLFSLKDSVALVVTDQIVEGHKSVTRGYFTPFTWAGTDVEPMHFTIILEFNDAGKIIKQTDWINYPAYMI